MDKTFSALRVSDGNVRDIVSLKNFPNCSSATNFRAASVVAGIDL
jgi:hypothetical protein